MAQTFIEANGQRYNVKQRFTTVTRYINEAEAAGHRVQLHGTDGARFALIPSAITMVGETLAEGETPAEDGEPAEAVASGPFAGAR